VTDRDPGTVLVSGFVGHDANTDTVRLSPSNLLLRLPTGGHHGYRESMARRMFMTTDARVSSSWVTFEPSSASCSGEPHRKGTPPLE
jgi:hypothetical protein